MIDLAKLSAPAAHEYVGTDIWTAIFPKNPPENIRFFEQDICKPWPSEWQESFDLVHQRTVLVNIRKTPIKNVLSQMIKLLKPDGWIQLMEGDFAPVPGNGPALQEFLSLGSWFFDAAGPGSDMGPMFQEELKSLDLRDVQDEVVYVHFGAKLKDHGPAVAQGSIEGLCAAIPGSLENIRGETRFYKSGN